MHPTKTNALSSFAASARPVSTYGSAITPSATPNTYGSWQSFGVLSASHDTHVLDVIVHSVSAAGASRCSMIDIGVDPLGGTAFQSVLAHAAVGSPGSFDDGTGIRPTHYRIPLRVAAGSSVGVRGKQNHATPTAFRAQVRGEGKPLYPELSFIGGVAEVIGANASTSQGVAITPGTTAQGAWTLIGTCTRNLKWIDIGYALDNTNVTAQALHVGVGYGDGTTIIPVITDAHVAADASERIYHMLTGRPCDIPAGSSLWGRAWTSAGVADAGQSLMLIGIA